MCGLKHVKVYLYDKGQYVTPFVGVWIETQSTSLDVLKQQVTPFVGVWIETPVCWDHDYQWYVTPFVGVWIETP